MDSIAIAPAMLAFTAAFIGAVWRSRLASTIMARGSLTTLSQTPSVKAARMTFKFFSVIPPTLYSSVAARISSSFAKSASGRHLVSLATERSFQARSIVHLSGSSPLTSQ
jgi:hypothetical protein